MDLTHLSSQLKLKTDFNAGSSLGLRDINSVTGIVDNSITSLQALIFANDNPKYDDLDTTNFDVTGITSGYDNKAFVFDIKKEYRYNLSSDITDHYVEENIAIQDHIALKPIILEVTGSIGEVNLIDSENDVKKDSAKNGQFSSLESFINRMGSLTSFAPNIINQALDIYNSAKFVYSTVNKLINTNAKDSTKKGPDYIEGYDTDIIKQTKQFEWINWFKTQWENRASFTIVTPYGVLSDMYIMELSASQPENSRYVTNLNIKFKQIRKAIIVKRGRKCSKERDIQETKAIEDIQDKNIIIDNAFKGQALTTTLNNQGSETADSKYQIIGSHDTATQSFNTNEFTGKISDEPMGITLKSFGVKEENAKNNN